MTKPSPKYDALRVMREQQAVEGKKKAKNAKAKPPRKASGTLRSGG